MLQICLILNPSWATGETGWDLGPFTKVRAPGQTSGLVAAEFNQTLRDRKQLHACAIKESAAQEDRKVKTNSHLEMLGAKAGYDPTPFPGNGQTTKPPLKPQPTNAPTLIH